LTYNLTIPLKILLICGIFLVRLLLLFRLLRRKIQRARQFTEAEKVIVSKQLVAFYGMLLAGGLLVIAVLLSLESISVGPRQIELLVGSWVSFGLSCLAVLSYVGLSAIRNQVTFSTRGLVKGRRAVIVGGIYLAIVILGLLFLPVIVFTAWINSDPFWALR
jgi:hypothetical protein